MLDIKEVIDSAQAEVKKEELEKAKIAIKAKLRSLENAKKVVANIQRELEDLYASIGDGSFST